VDSQPLLAFDAVWPAVAAGVQRLETETLPLPAAAGRVLRADVTATRDLPAAAVSVMDGFAVHSADTATTPSRLRLLTGDAYAGSSHPPRLSPGTAVAIATGGLVPDRADAIAVKEIVARHGDTITVKQPVAPGAHIRTAGEHLRRGALVIPAGVRLDPARIAAAADAGVVQVTVSQAPRVVVVATGSELVEPGQTPGPGQVVSSNGPMLAGWINQLLATEVQQLPRVPDRAEQLRAALARGLDGSDLLVITGGTSVGDRDLVKATLEQELGVQRLLWGIAQRPGKPTYVGRRGHQWVVALPGTPAAVAAGWYLLVKPLLLALIGADQPQPQRIPVITTAELGNNPSFTQLLWCRSEWRERQLLATPLAGSHPLSRIAAADLLLVVPPSGRPLPPGSPLSAIPVTR
jgi:molybdopterin molybdotransferase